MLRSAVISMLALFVLTGGFLIYWHMQPVPPVLVSATTQPIVAGAPGGDTESGIGHGQSAWADSYKKGELSSQFRADEYTPMKEAGKFKVVRPEWVFFLTRGQYLLIKGDEGIVHVDNGGEADKSLMDSAVPQSPDSGTLQNVELDLFPSKQADKPTLWMKTNNIAFDKETLRLYTQSYQDSNGVTIPGDQVPVTVRGDDYEFDGKGLTLHWDDRDDRLQLMEIAHGGRLEVKHPRKMSPPTTTQPATELESGLPVLAMVVPGASPTTHPEVPLTIYRSIFHDNVQVFQGNRQVASGDSMTLDFIPEEQKSTEDKSTKEGAPPTTQQFEIEPAAPRGAQNNAAGQGESTTTTTTQPTTQPKEEPMTIYWTGKLHITVLDEKPMMPLLVGESVVKLVGSPAELKSDSSVVHAAAIVYRAADGATQLQNSTDLPRVEVNRDDGATFSADSLSYNPETSVATILGRGEMHGPPNDKNGKMSATWTDHALVHVVGKVGDSKSFVDHVDLFGNVKVDHPKLSLTADELAMDLEKQATVGKGKKSGEQMKRVTATGNSVCRLMQNGQPTRGIDSDSLVLETVPGPDGNAVPHEIKADGNVKAFDPEQSLHAGHLEAILIPKPPTKTAKKPSDSDEELDVQSMDASSAVHAVLKNGSMADSEQLHMRIVDAHHQVELDGAPATLTNAQHSTLSGQVIHLLPDEDQQAVVVDGPGKAKLMRKASATQPARPVDLAWTGNLVGNGAANKIDVHDNVTGNTVDAQGDVDTVKTDSAHVDLMDVKPGDKHKSTTQPVDVGQSENKQIKTLILNGHVDAESVLTGADGTLLIRRALLTSILVHDAVAGRTTVPAPGEIELEDHRKPAATNPAAGAKAGDNNRGTMAIKWAGSLVYDQPANQIVFDRDVHAVFLQDAKDAAPMTLNHCDRLTVDLKTIPATKSTAAKPELQHVRADGAVDFQSKSIHFTADTVDYDPTTYLMTAHGTADKPGEVLDDQGGSAGSFRELIYNVQTQMPENINGGGGEIRH
jgi:hypothetical protein